MLDSGYILNKEPTEFLTELGVECESKRGVKDDYYYAS